MVISAVQKIYELNEMDGISSAVVRNYMSDNDNSNNSKYGYVLLGDALKDSIEID